VLTILRKLLFSKWTILIGLAVVAWQGWTLLRPKPWEPDELQKGAAENVCRTIAAAIPAKLPGIKSLAVVRLAGGDTDGFVSTKLAECLHRAGNYQVLRETFLKNLMKELKIDETPVATLEAAVAAGKKMGVDGVVFGEVTRFASDEVSANISMDLRVAKVATGEAVFVQSFDQREPPSPASVAGMSRSIRAASVIKRILIWLAAAALLPLLLIPMLKHFLEQESNAVNLAMLVALSLFDLALAFVLCGFIIFGWIPGILLVVATAAGGIYNYWLLTTVERLRK